MEVHHHPHVEKKNFKEYLLEGLMIFLAVSMGFIAEQIREHFTEKETERKYVESYLEDLKSDRLRFDRIINKNNQTITYIAETLKLLHQSTITDSIAARLHFLNSWNHGNFNMIFNRRTSNQLKMAGGYKIISNQAVSDSMAKRDIDADWNDMLRERIYNLGLEISTKAAPKIFDNYQMYDFLFTDRKDGSGININVILVDTVSYKKFLASNKKILLLPANKQDIALYTDLIIIFQRIVTNYNVSLKDYKESSINLTALIHKQYHLESE